MPTTRRNYIGLLHAIRGAADNELIEFMVPPERVSVSYRAEVLRVRLAGDQRFEGEYAVRVEFDSGRMEREAFAQRFARERGIQTPEIHLWAPPSALYDRGWMLMDYIDGRQIVSGATRGDYVRALFQSFSDMPRQSAEAAAALHSIDATGLVRGLGVSGLPGADLEWLYSDATQMGDARLMKAVARLIQTRPHTGRIVLCHGNLHPVNFLRDSRGDWVFDWFFAQADDPLYDVANTSLLFAHAPTRMRSSARRVVEAIGRRMASDFVGKYERATGTAVDPVRLAWFEDLIAIRTLVELEKLRKAGRGDDPSAAPYVLLEPAFLERISRHDDAARA